MVLFWLNQREILLFIFLVEFDMSIFSQEIHQKQHLILSSGYTNNPNFVIKPIYQKPNKENIISNPKISNDVFIIRQELPAFDGNYRLEYIRKLVDLETYAAGKFFNIINNT